MDQEAFHLSRQRLLDDQRLVCVSGGLYGPLQCGAVLTRVRVNNTRPQNFRNPILKLEKMSKSLAWLKNKTNSNVRVS